MDLRKKFSLKCALEQIFCPRVAIAEDVYRVDYVRNERVLFAQLFVLTLIPTLLFLMSVVFLSVFLFVSFAIYLLVVRYDFLELKNEEGLLVITKPDLLKRKRSREIELDSIEEITSINGDVILMLVEGRKVKITTLFPSVPFIFKIFSKEESIRKFLVHQMELEARREKPLQTHRRSNES